MPIIQLLKHLFTFFEKKETFLVVEILPHCAYVAQVSADFENKKLSLDKIRSFDANDPKSFKICVKKFGAAEKHKVIVSLDSQHATTVYSAVTIVRDDPKAVIDESDLENIIAQAVWKFFDRQRGRAAAKMGINDFDLLLVDVRVGDIKLDGHRVVNPVGFKARCVEVQLGQTFTTRDIINTLKEGIAIDRVQSIGEFGAYLSRVIGRVNNQSKFLLANIFPDESSFFFVDGFRLSYLAKHDWGEGKLNSALVNSLAVDLITAKKIMNIYKKNEASPHFIKKIENILLGELENFAVKLSRLVSKTGINLVYINSFEKLPDIVFSRYFKNKIKTSSKLSAVNNEFLNEHYPYQLNYAKEAYKNNSFPIFAALIETTFMPRYAKMSYMAKKRVRWLSPQ